MQRSGLAVAVLALLRERPTHPYRIQQLIKQRGKHLVINVGQRSQLYKTIDRLLEQGLIAVAEVERDAARPERTVYTITPEGSRTVVRWAAEMLAVPRRDFPEFTAGLAFLPMLTVAEVIGALGTRLAALHAELAELEADRRSAPAELPRLVLVEIEYMIAHLRADTGWIEALLEDLRSGRLDWTREQMLALAEKFEPAGGG